MMWKYFAPDKTLIHVGVLAMVVSSTSNAAFSWCLRLVIDGAMGKGGKKTQKETLKKMSVLIVAGSIGSYIRTLTLGIVSARAERRLRESLFKSLMRQEAAFYDFDASGAGAAASAESSAASTASSAASPSAEEDEEPPSSRNEVTEAMVDDWISRDVTGAVAQLTTTCMNSVRYTGSMLSGSSAAVHLADKATFNFAALTLGVVCVAVPAVIMRRKKLLKAEELRRVLGVEASSFLLEKFGAFRTVRSFAREENEGAAFGERNEATAGADEAIAARKSAYMATIDLCGKAGSIIVVGYGSVLAQSGALTAGDLVAFVTSTSLAGAGMMGLLRAMGDDWQSPAWRVLKLIEREPAIPLTGGGSGPADLEGRVAFEGVEFSYPAASASATSGDGVASAGSEQPVLALSNFQLEATPGQVVALMGPSGSGKTTVGRLLLGLYRPTAGRILLDGKDLASYDPSWLRATQIGVVEQEPRLFSCSVRENIRYGNLAADDAAVEEAAKVANVHEVITALPHGYDTVLGKQGLALSGGQKQKISIARAVIKKPAILLLDEGTSALPHEVR